MQFVQKVFNPDPKNVLQIMIITKQIIYFALLQNIPLPDKSDRHSIIQQINLLKSSYL